MRLRPLPALSDNYIWLLHDDRDAVVVDPGDPAPVRQALQQDGLRLVAILVTHHHGDHTGGVHALREATGATVYGTAREPMPQPCTPLREGDRLRLLGRDFTVLEVPGHTAGHIAFYAPATARLAGLLFCGDTLFSGGCGRLFDGTPAQMAASLQRLAALPGDTQVCCAHEYTLDNLRFAQAVEPDNPALAEYTRLCRERRAAGQPTLPSTLALERQINPFLRCGETRVMRAAQAFDHNASDEVAVFTALRAWKNQFT